MLEVATRWKAAVNTEHLLRMATCSAETRREKQISGFALEMRFAFPPCMLHVPPLRYLV
jgi:hypothetical protein